MTTCSICLDHLEQPVCCIPCGHLFCNQCFSDWRNRHNNQCPECREPFTTVQSIYLDTESIKELFVERTRLNDSVNELKETIENLRQNPSNEDQKVLEFVEKKDNFERAEATCKSLPIQKSNSVARFATIIFLIFTSVCFLYLGVCIFTERFSEKPEFLDDVVVRHLEFLNGSSTYITSTFLSAATYVEYFYGTYTQAGINYIMNCTNSISEKANTYFSEDVKTFDYKLTVYWACQVVNAVLFILYFLIFFAMFSFLVLFMLIGLILSYAVLIFIYCFLLICLCSLIFLKNLLSFFLLL